LKAVISRLFTPKV